MRKLTLIVGLLVAANILLAQEQDINEAEQPPVRLEKFKERLDLSDDQVAELKRVQESHKSDMKSFKNDEYTSRSERLRALADIVEEREKRVAEILNDDQEAELKVIQSEVREKVKARRARKKERRKG